jgi:hypothetical protein
MRRFRVLCVETWPQSAISPGVGVLLDPQPQRGEIRLTVRGQAAAPDKNDHYRCRRICARRRAIAFRFRAAFARLRVRCSAPVHGCAPRCYPCPTARRAVSKAPRTSLVGHPVLDSPTA